MAMLETPSRIWRRIEAVEGRDMPSLPSLPDFDDSAESGQHSNDGPGDEDLSSPIQSTPAAVSSHTVTSTIRPTSSTSSTARFASSFASRSTKSGPSASGQSVLSESGGLTHQGYPDSFDVSRIPSLPAILHEQSTHLYTEEEDMEESHESIPDVYLPPAEDDVEDHDGEQDMSLADALQSVSRPGSPFSPNGPEHEPTPKKYDYSVSLRSEAMPSPLDRYRNVAFRKPLARTRTPSLSRTTPSPDSSPTNSTPHHSGSIPLSDSASVSPLPVATTPSHQNEAEENNPVTPHTRRRSFLLSVINSTARPRLKFPTPHPRYTEKLGAGSPSAAPGPAEVLSQWQTPARVLDDNADRASFISTASSHDLTTHHRVNTSFDPAMGLQGHGLGRFNAGKLNSYLHGLNRRLQEENEGLVERLRKVEEEKVVPAPGRRLSGDGRRVSVGGTVLGDVEEDVGGEGWVEEKAELEDIVDAFKDEVQRCIGEKEEVEKALEEEREGRIRDKEKWKERMGEVEKGVECIVKELEEKLLEAERRAKELDDEKEEQARNAEKIILELEAERNFATERAEKAEQALESGMALGGELRDANERVRKVMADLRNANAQIKELEDEVLRSDGRIDELEKELLEEKEMTGDLEQELQIKVDELATTKHRMQTVQEEARRVEEGLREDAERASEAARQMETALEAAEDKIMADGEELANLRGKTSKVVNNTSGISPIHRQVLAMSIRAPRTPGPLRDMSWLNNTTADPTVSPLVAEISRLQHELDRANESIDDKLDRLEDAGLGVVGLTQQLENARARIATLEEEIARLTRREDRRTHHLERARCRKCLAKVDLRGLLCVVDGNESSLEMAGESLSSDPPTPPTKTSEALRANLRSVNMQLDVMRKQWEEERRRLVGEKAVLQDAAHRLNVQVLTAKDEIKRVVETEKASEKKRVSVQEELDKVKRTVADIESDLESERTSLRTLTAEQDRVQRDREDVLLQLQRTESDMDDVKKQLQKFKQENRDLETELQANVNANQKAHLLEVRVAETMESIEQLRQERSLLNADHKELQRRFSEITEHANKLRDEYATSQTSHDNRRHQLDLHRVEIDDLRRALSERADELQRTEAEKNRIAAEKSDVAKTVAALEADLRRVRKDAESLGQDLKLLRAEKDKLESKQRAELSNAERVKKQNQTQLRLLNEQLEGQQLKAMQALEDLKNHVCVMDQYQLSALKVRHNKECKGLMVQIRYLKAKFTREASLRCDLGYQKQYILILLSRFEKSERTVLASIASLGFPVPVSTPAKNRSLKRTALAVIFILRAKHASEVWRDHSSSKEDIAAALQEVRSRRIAATSS